MKKYLMVAAMAVSALLITTSISFAGEITQVEKQPIENTKMKPDFKPPHPNFHKRGPHHGPSKAEMQAKKLEFENRLNLTEEQKKKIDENRAKDRELMKPVFEEMKAKRHEMKMVDFDATLTPEQKTAKKEELQTQMKVLKEKANNVRENNMKNFESLLTDEQKKEFSKIREEQKKDMEKRKTEFEKIKKRGPEYHLPVQPKPIKVDK